MDIPMAYFLLPPGIRWKVNRHAMTHRPSVPLGAPQRQETATPPEVSILPGLATNINELVTLPGSGETGTYCRLAGVSDRGLDRLVEQAIELGQPLILELRGHVLLGEVCARAPLAGVHRVSFAVEHDVDTRTVPSWSASLQRPES
jgi:hypothetical protein